MLKTNLEVELKFKVENVPFLFKKLKGLNPKISYIKDEIFGTGEMRKNPVKIRKRTSCTNEGVKIKFDKTTPIKDKIKKIIEEEAKGIPKEFICESSYEKIRYSYILLNKVEITIDFYPIGVYCEIEGDLGKIRKIAKALGFDLNDNIKKNIDMVYVDWGKIHNRKFLFHWGFGKI